MHGRCAMPNLKSPHRLGTLAAAAALLLLLTLLPSAAAVTEEEAKQAFQAAGCTACHRKGNIGYPWEDIVTRLKEANGKYKSLDELVAKEIGPLVEQRLGQKVETWDQLFQVMAQYVGKTPDDPNVAKTEQFLASLFAPSGGQPTETAKETATAQSPTSTEARKTETTTTTKTAAETSTGTSSKQTTTATKTGQEVGGAAGTGGSPTATTTKYKGISFTAAIGIAIAIIAIVVGFFLARGG